jgi:DNA-binding transcriptional MerR regulator
MSVFTVSEVAKLSGVSVRTLHHYDEIGLLKPACVGENGYRYYGKDELLRLQQILFHRELGFPLEEVRQVLDAPDFDRMAALRSHRGRLMAEARRYRALVKTLDETLAALEGETEMDDKAMFKGFDPAKQAEYEAWLVEKYGPGMQARIDEAKVATKGWKQADFDKAQAEVEEIEADMAGAMAAGLPADSAAVRAIMRRLHGWVGRSWNRTPTREAFTGLGQLYQDHPDFRARYDGRAAGLSDYMAEAMRAFSEAELA